MFKTSFLLQAAQSHVRQVQQLNQQLAQQHYYVQDLLVNVQSLQVGYLLHSTQHDFVSGMYGVSR